MLSRFDQCRRFWVEITCVTSDSSQRPTCSVEAMEWKWRPPFSPGRLSPSTLFFRPRFPSKIVQYNVLHFGFCFVFYNCDIISFSSADQMFSSSTKLPSVFPDSASAEYCTSFTFPYVQSSLFLQYLMIMTRKKHIIS